MKKRKNESEGGWTGKGGVYVCVGGGGGGEGGGGGGGGRGRMG